MTVAAKKIVDQALALPEGERLVLYRLLRDSLPHEDDIVSQEEWSEEWKKELEKRIEEMESGKDPGVPLETVWEDLRKLSKKR